MKYKLVYIEWEDANADTALGWQKKEKVDEWLNDGAMIIQQVGFIYKETKKFICFASRISPASKCYDLAFSGLFKIPKTWIRKRKVLKI